MNNPSFALLRHNQNQQNQFDTKKLQELRQHNLFDQYSFYRAFVRDLRAAKKEVIIYCPFVSKYRSEFFRRTLKELQHRNVAVFIFTRPVDEHENVMKTDVTSALRDYVSLGAVITYLPGYIHEKVAIIDREILWEGSLNILSQRKSREMMRRFSDQSMAIQVLEHLKLNRWLAEGYRHQYERLYHDLVAANRRTLPSKWFWLSLGLVALAIWLLLSLQVMIGPLQNAIGIMRLFF